jgi:hypothetical protein
MTETEAPRYLTFNPKVGLYDLEINQDPISLKGRGVYLTYYQEHIIVYISPQWVIARSL